MRTVVLGGYGNFGARIVRRLAARSKETGIELIAAGRHPEQGHAACGFDASIGQARLDIRDPDFPDALKALKPNLVPIASVPSRARTTGSPRPALKPNQTTSTSK